MTFNEINSEGGPAFPSAEIEVAGVRMASFGMTYRQWLIGRALSGILSSSRVYATAEDAARDAIAIADAVLAEFSKKQK